ncbi:MAG: zinc-binding dehydrogenase [Anaerolineales bacterium]
MKAAVFTECGGPEKIHLAKVPRPEIKSDQVLVRVATSALNHMDLWTLRGPADDSDRFPFWGGADVAGQVAEVGADVDEYVAGDRVLINPSLYCGKCEYCIAGEESLCVDYGILGGEIPGGFAEYVAVAAKSLMRLPEDISYQEAAAIPLVFQTAWRAVITQARLRPGEDILILGASGGVASAAIQIAKLAGARVFTVTSSPEKVAKAQDLDADLVFDRTSEDYWAEIKRVTEQRGVDVVIESVGAATWAQSLDSLANGGRLVTYGRTTGRMGETNISRVFWYQLHIIGSTMANRKEFARVMRLVFDHKLHAVIDSGYPLEQASAAYERLAEGKQFGKILIQIANL